MSLNANYLRRCFQCGNVRSNFPLSVHHTNLTNVVWHNVLGKPNVINKRQYQMHNWSRNITSSTSSSPNVTVRPNFIARKQSRKACQIASNVRGKTTNFLSSGTSYKQSSISMPTTDVRQEHHNAENPSFVPQKILILPKITRYAFEKQRCSNLNDIEFRKKLAEKGSDIKRLLERHNAHCQSLEKLLKELRESGVDIRVCEKKKDYTSEVVDWADLIISAGGDGTFLLAATKVFGDKPMIGVNTDFVGSEGFLCLPRVYSNDMRKALDMMRSGSYRWKRRSRIRVTVEGSDTSDPIDLHEEELTYPDHRRRHDSEKERTLERKLNGEPCAGQLIPLRALNEVFIGESLSSRMSYYEIAIDDGPLEKQKSSGITLCTGTGSTSWSFNINKLSEQSVEEILKIANRQTGSNYPTNQESVKTVADTFNGRLLFDPRVLKMVYTIRDPVVHGIYQVNKPRGFAKKITIRSRCRDACLTVDAGTSYLFNDGAIATFEMHEEDAIQTLQLVD